MATPVPQVPNGTIPIMAGGVPQSTVIYQQQPVVVAGAPQSGAHLQYNTNTDSRRNFSSRNPNEEQCKIFVGGVSKTTTEETLRAHFRKFGEIADSVIMSDKVTKEPRGFAFVTFKSPESVYAVIEQCNNGGHTLDGKIIDPKPAVPQGPAQQTKLHTMMYDAEKAQIMANQGNMYKGPMKIAPELKVFVGGVGAGTTEEDVKQYFSSFGKVIAVDMPVHHVYKCPKGFAFVGFENLDTVMAVTKDRYHQINGKTVEVKGADEQQAHVNRKRNEGEGGYNRSQYGNFNRGGNKLSSDVQPGTIGTISGYGAYANLSATPQQVIIPQNNGGIAQYATVQVPATAGATGGYVFDPATNTYYQLPAATVLGTSGVMGATAGSPYGGIQLVSNPGVAGQMLASPQVQRPGTVTADMMSGLGGAGQLGTVYPSETSTFGPSRTHLLGGGHQPIAGTTVADPHVVYSNAAALSVGESQVSSRGYHPYGR